MRYLVSETRGKKHYSGRADERLYKTKEGAEARVKLVKRITGKKYFVTEIT